MPETEVIYYRDHDGSVPVLEWLTALARRNKKAAVKCAARIDILRELGHELRRPIADYLRDGIYELRTRVGTVNYRILYFFHGQRVVVLAHGLTKGKEVPQTDIERSLQRKAAFEKDPRRHTFVEETPNAKDH
jgi:phage-related protein